MASDFSLIDFLTNEDLPELNIPADQLRQTATTSSNIHQNTTNNNIESHLRSFEELMDTLPSIDDRHVPTYRYDSQKNTTVGNHEKMLNKLSYL